MSCSQVETYHASELNEGALRKKGRHLPHSGRDDDDDDDACGQSRSARESFGVHEWQVQQPGDLKLDRQPLERVEREIGERRNSFWKKSRRSAATLDQLSCQRHVGVRGHER